MSGTTTEALPKWNKPGAFSPGRDPLGLQATSVRLYTDLLPGLTNVTNRLRYFSFYCWVLWKFERTEHSSSIKKWALFIRRAEAIYALSCQVFDSEAAFGMAGSEWARRYPEFFNSSSLDIRPWTDKPNQDGQYLKAGRGNFGQFYVASMFEMGMIEPHPDDARIHLVTQSKGLLLAEAVEQSCGSTSSVLMESIKTGSINFDACLKIGECLHPSLLAAVSAERALLVEYLTGADRTDPTASGRRMTLRNLLGLLDQSGDEADFDFRKALYAQQKMNAVAPPAATENLLGWRAYFVNELTHIALEVLLNGLVTSVSANEGQKVEDALVGLIENVWSDKASLASSLEAVAGQIEDLGFEAQHEMGGQLASRAGRGDAPQADEVELAIELLLSLWMRWRDDANVVSQLNKQSFAARSAAGVFRLLDQFRDASLLKALVALLRRYLITNHQTIAGQKLAATGIFTYRFGLDEGRLVEPSFAQYNFTTPRIPNLLTFARDGGLLEGNKITEAGRAFLDAV